MRLRDLEDAEMGEDGVRGRMNGLASRCGGGMFLGWRRWRFFAFVRGWKMTVVRGTCEEDAVRNQNHLFLLDTAD